MIAAAAKKVNGSRVAPAATRELYISSFRFTTEISDVSLSSTSHKLPRPGRAKRHTCGSMTRRNI